MIHGYSRNHSIRKAKKLVYDRKGIYLSKNHHVLRNIFSIHPKCKKAMKNNLGFTVREIMLEAAMRKNTRRIMNSLPKYLREVCHAKQNRTKTILNNN